MIKTKISLVEKRWVESSNKNSIKFSVTDVKDLQSKSTNVTVMKTNIKMNKFARI